MHRLLAALPALLLILPGVAGAEGDRGLALRRTPTVQAVDRMARSVVSISAAEPARERNPFALFDDPLFDDFFNRHLDDSRPPSAKRNLGSGVVVDSAGHVLTNHHVVAQASGILVGTRDGKEYPATLVGSDPQFDLAILKIDSPGAIPAAPIGSSDDLMIGEPVIAIGNPFGLSHTITTGVVSALHRAIRGERNTLYSDFIQTDASINPGNSGGPLINILGEVIGINTAIYRGGEGIGFAIPIDKARKVMGELIRHGRVQRGWFGIFIQDLNRGLRESFDYPAGGGVLVNRVAPEAKDGLAEGDIIVAFGGRDVSGMTQFAELAADHLPGDRVRTRVIRRGKEVEATLTCRKIEPGEAASLAWDLLGMSFEWRKGREGRRMEVGRVRKGSNAASIGIEPGDVIHEIDRKPLRNEDDLVSAMAGAVYRERIPLTLGRGNRLYRLAL
jgi:Do/DeqQ family serine protease